LTAFTTLIRDLHVGFRTSRAEGLEWLHLTNRLALDGILFLPHQLRSNNTNIMMSAGLQIYSVGGSLQAALGLHDCILASGPASRSIAMVDLPVWRSGEVLNWASGDFRVGLQHGRFMLHQAEFGVTSEVLPAPREVIRLQSTATRLLSKLLAVPQEWSSMDYEQCFSTVQALLTGLLESWGQPRDGFCQIAAVALDFGRRPKPAGIRAAIVMYSPSRHCPPLWPRRPANFPAQPRFDGICQFRRRAAKELAK
jgi:ATP-dependent protease ClpP protease subunit